MLGYVCVFPFDVRAIHFCPVIFIIPPKPLPLHHFHQYLSQNMCNLTAPFIFTHLPRLPLKKREPAKCCFPLYAPGGANESSNLFSRLTNLLYSLTKASWTVPTGPLRCLAMMISMMFLSSDSLS